MFTMDLWSDLTVALGLAFDSDTRLGLVAALFFFCIASPVDFANLCIRTSFALEDMPDRTHLMNIIFETPMLIFNLYLVLGCVRRSVRSLSPCRRSHHADCMHGAHAWSNASPGHHSLAHPRHIYS